MLVAPNASEVVMLRNILNNEAPQNWVLKLFKNDHGPAAGDTEADYAEATFVGYAPIVLGGASWTITPGAPSTAAYAKRTFTCTLGGPTELIYGYYMVQETSGKIMEAEKFTDGPYPVTAAGNSVAVTPRFQLRSLVND